MVDLVEKLKMEAGPLAKYSHLPDDYFFFPKLEGEIGPHMIFNGKKVLNWSLNNYLGLANHPEVRKADADAAAEFGLGYPMGARMMSGNSKYHIQLEKELASFVKKEDAMLLNFGYQGVISIIDAIVNRKDVIVYDAESHACIIDGVRLHMGKRFVSAHNDMDSLEKQLERATKLANETGGGILFADAIGEVYIQTTDNRVGINRVPCPLSIRLLDFRCFHSHVLSGEPRPRCSQGSGIK